MNVEEFRKLETYKKDETSKKIVDWSVVIKDLCSKKQVFNFKTFKSTVQRLFPQKTSLNYSEMYRVLESLKKKDSKYEVECRMTQDKEVVYLIVKKEEKSEKT